MQTSALLEVPLHKGRALVRGNVSDVSRSGVGFRTSAPEIVRPAGSLIVVRFWLDGKAFQVPGELVWAQSLESGETTAGVQLDLTKARASARYAFERWTRAIERASETPDALPAHEQLECRLAALIGNLDALVAAVGKDGPGLDPVALRHVDRTAEAMQNAITALQLTRKR